MTRRVIKKHDAGFMRNTVVYYYRGIQAIGTGTQVARKTENRVAISIGLLRCRSIGTDADGVVVVAPGPLPVDSASPLSVALGITIATLSNRFAVGSPSALSRTDTPLRWTLAEHGDAVCSEWFAAFDELNSVDIWVAETLLVPIVEK